MFEARLAALPGIPNCAAVTRTLRGHARLCSLYVTTCVNFGSNYRGDVTRRYSCACAREWDFGARFQTVGRNCAGCGLQRGVRLLFKLLLRAMRLGSHQKFELFAVGLGEERREAYAKAYLLGGVDDVTPAGDDARREQQLDLDKVARLDEVLGEDEAARDADICDHALSPSALSLPTHTQVDLITLELPALPPTLVLVVGFHHFKSNIVTGAATSRAPQVKGAASFRQTGDGTCAVCPVGRSAPVRGSRRKVTIVSDF